MPMRVPTIHVVSIYKNVPTLIYLRSYYPEGCTDASLFEH
jgi:hypothetical protein